MGYIRVFPYNSPVVGEKFYFAVDLDLSHGLDVENGGDWKEIDVAVEVISGQLTFADNLGSIHHRDTIKLLRNGDNPVSIPALFVAEVTDADIEIGVLFSINGRHLVGTNEQFMARKE